MKISKKDALMWFEFFAALPEEEELMPHQQEIALAALAQIETAVNKRREAMAAKNRGAGKPIRADVFRGGSGEVPARLLLLSAGNGAECGSKDE